MKLLKLLASLLAIGIQVSYSASVSEDPTPKKDDRYVLGVDSVRRVQAKQRCENDGGKLAAIRSLKDLDDLQERLATEENANGFWIGGLYKDNSKCKGKPFQLDCWYWDDKINKEFNSDLILFAEGVQNGKPPRSSAMLLKPGDELTLDYDAGAELHPYICDRKASNIPPDECKGKKFRRIRKPLKGQRYLISRDSVRRIEAQFRCFNKGGQLATIQVKKDISDLEARFAHIPYSQNYWIGGLYKDSEHCKHKPFQLECWYWDEVNANQRYYNSSLVSFSENAQLGKPPRTSAMLLSTGTPFTLNYDAGAELHTYICDLKPSLIESPASYCV